MLKKKVDVIASDQRERSNLVFRCRKPKIASPAPVGVGRGRFAPPASQRRSRGGARNDKFRYFQHPANDGNRSFPPAERSFMKQRTTLGCLAVFFLLGCLLPASAICAAGNIGAYYLLRKPVVLRDPTQISHEMDRIESEVRDLRDVSDPSPVKRTLITPDQLRAKMTADFEKSYSRAEAQDDEDEYAAFGVLNPNFDLFSFYLNTYSTYVLGYYDPEERQLYVVSGGGFGPSEESTFAHEYLHSLQFQRPGLTADTWDSGANSDIQSGKQALVEGEAEFVEEMWEKRYFSLGDQIDYYKQSLAELNLDYFRIPSFLEREMDFPYLEGKNFVASLYKEGGWAAVDAAFRDPPDSTAMILHPEKYLQGEQPVTVAKPILAGEFGSDWQVADDDVMGEFSTDLILASQMGSNQAAQAAAGWSGDRFLVLRNERLGETAVIWHTAWNTQTDADGFAAALRSYDSLRFKGHPGDSGPCWFAVDVACQSQFGSDVWWFYGPNEDVVQKFNGGERHRGSQCQFPPTRRSLARASLRRIITTAPYFPLFHRRPYIHGKGSEDGRTMAQMG